MGSVQRMGAQHRNARCSGKMLGGADSSAYNGVHGNIDDSSRQRLAGSAMISSSQQDRCKHVLAMR